MANLGPHVSALLDLMRGGKKRGKPLPLLMKLLEGKPKVPPDLRAFLTVWAERKQSFIDVGEYTLEDNHLDDELDDRDDILCIGRSIGGDIYVVDRRLRTSAISRLVHDDGWSEGERYDGLEKLLRSMVKAAHDDDEETDLDDLLSAKPGAGPGDLQIVSVKKSVDPAKASPATRKKVKGADEVVGRYGAFMNDDRELVLFDDQTARAIAVKPALVVNHYCQSPDGLRVLAPASGGLWEVDVASGKATALVTSKNGFISACYVGDRVAATPAKHPFEMQLYTRGKGGLEKDGAPVPTKKLQTLGTVAGGRLVSLLSDQPDQLCHLFGVRDSALRPLATFRGLYFIWDGADGRVFLRNWKEQDFEVKNLDAALDAAFAKKAAPIRI